MQGRHRRPQRRKSRRGLDGFPAKTERENDGKNAEHPSHHCDRARMAAKRTLAYAAVGLE
ncbi:hypothetical protein VNF293_42430 (plasmid) [Atlantibacter hermannii]